MKEVVDQLIEERAPWLRRGGPGVSGARALLHKLLGYERTVSIAEALEPMPGPDIMAQISCADFELK